MIVKKLIEILEKQYENAEITFASGEGLDKIEFEGDTVILVTKEINE